MKKINNIIQEKFKNKIQEIFGGKIKIIGEYIDSKTKILVETQYGICLSRPSNLSMGIEPRITSAINKNEYFTYKANVIHNEKYSYENINYINMKTKINIYCKVCKKYFLQTPDCHLSGGGCSRCSHNYRINLEEFIKTSKNIHGNLYGYDKCVYVNNSTKIKIYCKVCKKYFSQIPKNHLNGHGCHLCCGNRTKENQDIYILKDFVLNIYKIGRAKSPKKRCKLINNSYYKQHNIIQVLKEWKLKGKFEYTIHKKYTNNRINHPYYTNKYLDGFTEWFKLSELELKEIIYYIDHL